MTKVKFKRQFDTSYKGKPYQNESGKSVTKPSMTLTVRELMERHTRGLETGTLQREEIYLPDGMEVPNITDLTDLVYQREELKQKQDELEERIRTEKENKRVERERTKQREAERNQADDQNSKPNSKDTKPETT